MKVAITADVHLTSRQQNPERFQILEHLLDELQQRKISVLIIAGDLFDASRQDYGEFERLCRRPSARATSIVIIPGNHDPAISRNDIVADNVKIIDQPGIHEFDGETVLFLPYRDGRTMGEEMQPFADSLPANRWVLVSHGDWADGLRVPNPVEPGVYMPLTRPDVELHKPARVFLGHIHMALDAPPVYYVGSPCGLDISETGRRRCLVYDTASRQVEPLMLSPPVLYFNESFVIVPAPDEAEYLRAQIAARIRQWGLTEDERKRVQLRVKVSGYATNRAGILEVVRNVFAGFSYYKGQGPDVDDVRISDDEERRHIAEEVRAAVNRLQWPTDMDQPQADEILLEALRVIYGQ